mmetsp:Transcript_10617/g.42826  ORF Transcript_10617/g.42826 Transcript_10617/m.42826 type:complete len:328 (+) Transcript_10617:1548-2531(+)
MRNLRREVIHRRMRTHHALEEKSAPAPVPNRREMAQHLDKGAGFERRFRATMRVSFALPDDVPRQRFDHARGDRGHESLLCFTQSALVILLHVSHQVGHRSRQVHQITALVLRPPRALRDLDCLVLLQERLFQQRPDRRLRHQLGHRLLRILRRRELQHLSRVFPRHVIHRVANLRSELRHQLGVHGTRHVRERLEPLIQVIEHPAAAEVVRLLRLGRIGKQPSRRQRLRHPRLHSGPDSLRDDVETVAVEPVQHPNRARERVRRDRIEFRYPVLRGAQQVAQRVVRNLEDASVRRVASSPTDAAKLAEAIEQHGGRPGGKGSGPRE